ncbi:MAG: YtxH domain-containing protein [Candidatus Saccharibacteria bacterium]
MENSNVTGKVIGAIIIGTLLGATIGLLFAPYKGSRTRNRISRRSRNLAFKMREEANSLLRKAEEIENSVERKLHNLAH